MFRQILFKGRVYNEMVVDVYQNHTAAVVFEALSFELPLCETLVPDNNALLLSQVHCVHLFNDTKGSPYFSHSINGHAFWVTFRIPYIARPFTHSSKPPIFY